LAVLCTGYGHAHDGEVLFPGFEFPLGKEQFCRDIDGTDHLPLYRDRGFAEKPCLPQQFHLFNMARIPHGLFLHIGDIQGFDEGAKPVGIKYFQGADLGKVDEFGFAQGGSFNDPPVFHIKGGPEIFFNHINGGEHGLVFPGLGPDFRQASHIDDGGFGLVQQMPAIAREHIAHARCYPAIHNGGDVFSLGKAIQSQGVFREKGDIHHIFASLDNGFKGLIPQESGYGADDHIKSGDKGFQGFPVGKILLNRLNSGMGFKFCQCFFADIGHTDLYILVFCKIKGHGAAHKTAAKNNNFHIIASIYYLNFIC